MSIATPPVVAGSVGRAPRDQRLDFFRGVTMLIIFIAHTPGNSWNDWIPARFGFHQVQNFLSSVQVAQVQGPLGVFFKIRVGGLQAQKCFGASGRFIGCRCV